jgi:hypothetical protein
MMMRLNASNGWDGSVYPVSVFHRVGVYVYGMIQ